VCTACHSVGSCLAAIGDFDGPSDDPCQPLGTAKPRPIARLSVCEPWHTLLGRDDEPGLPMPDDGDGASLLVFGRGGTQKTTMLLELAAHVAKMRDCNAVWVPTEPNQTRDMLMGIAKRIGFDASALRFTTASSLAGICEQLQARPRTLVVVDSLSVFDAPVVAWHAIRRACSGAAFAGVVHVNKDGRMAGAEKLRHLCDTVVRTSRSSVAISGKNRFGPVRSVRKPEKYRG